MPVVLDNSGNVLVQALFPCWFNYGLQKLYCEYTLNVNLGVGVCHSLNLMIFDFKYNTLVMPNCENLSYCQRGVVLYLTAQEWLLVCLLPTFNPDGVDIQSKGYSCAVGATGR